MSEKLQSKVIFLLAILLILTTGVIIGHWIISRSSRDLGNGIVKSSFPELCVYSLGVGSEILGLIGALKREKWPLVPIIIFLSLVLIACIGCYLNIITGGKEAIKLILGMLESDNEHGKDMIIVLLVITFIFVVAMFSLVFIIELYREIIFDDIDDEEERKLLEPLSASSASPSPMEKTPKTPKSSQSKSGYFIFNNE